MSTNAEIMADAMEWYADGDPTSTPPAHMLHLSPFEGLALMFLLHDLDYVIGKKGIRALAPVVRAGDLDAISTALKEIPLRPERLSPYN